MMAVSSVVWYMNCSSLINTIMKNMFLAAASIGVLIAALVVAFGKSNENREKGRVKGAAKSAYDLMNQGIGGLERSTKHNLS